MGRDLDATTIRIAILMFIAAAIFEPIAFIVGGTLLVLAVLLVRARRRPGRAPARRPTD